MSNGSEFSFSMSWQPGTDLMQCSAEAMGLEGPWGRAHPTQGCLLPPALPLHLPPPTELQMLPGQNGCGHTEPTIACSESFPGRRAVLVSPGHRSAAACGVSVQRVWRRWASQQCPPEPGPTAPTSPLPFISLPALPAPQTPPLFVKYPIIIITLSSELRSRPQLGLVLGFLLLFQF